VEIDPGIETHIHLPRRIGTTGIAHLLAAAERHGPHGQNRDFQPRTAEIAVFHGFLLCSGQQALKDAMRRVNCRARQPPPPSPSPCPDPLPKLGQCKPSKTSPTRSPPCLISSPPAIAAP